MLGLGLMVLIFCGDVRFSDLNRYLRLEIQDYKGALSHSVAKLTRFCMPIEENRKKRFGKVKRMGRSRHTKNFMGENHDLSS